MSTQTLPNGASSDASPSFPSPLTPADVIFTPATTHQRLLSWTLNGASWAPPLTIDQYVGRETTLSETALSANGGTTYYVLHHKSDPELIVSACEVTQKKALITADSHVKAVDAYAIASVFTNPLFRGRGMAGYMLRRVQKEVDGRSELGALYSDIGRVYYTGLGWKDFRSPQVLFGLREGFEVPAANGGNGVVLLSQEDVAGLCKRDTREMENEFRALAEKGDGKTHIAFLPSPEQMLWHFARDAFVCQAMRSRKVEHRGARTADGAAWVYWDHDLRDDKLKVLRIAVCRSDAVEKQRADIKTLLLAALAEARSWDLPKVLVWAPDTNVSGAALQIWHELGKKLQVTFEEREDGSIPSLRWKGGKSLDAVVWHHNEYYAWC